MATATLFSLPNLFAPLQAFVHWLAGGTPEPAATPAPVRVLEPSASRAVAGRMVISGRLEDVCAELDRLAALEAR